MNIEHFGFLSWFLRKCGRLKRKNHAQDCGTLIANVPRSQRPAILPWSSGLKWRPSFRWYGRFTRYRPAAGLLLDTPRGIFKNPRVKTRAKKCARELLATNVV